MSSSSPFAVARRSLGLLIEFGGLAVLAHQFGSWMR